MYRLRDVILVVLVLPLLVPIIAILSLVIFLSLGRPVLFVQRRTGLRGAHFRLYKFRTMSKRESVEGTLLSDGDRITKTGAFLRSASLDELPSLFNVLKGDMSLVGPRPLLTNYDSLYNEQQLRRHEVMPGVTGWAQVNGRNAISWDKKFKFDVWYVDNRSFLLDLKIILLTIKKVLIRDGISAEGEATMPEFKGDDK